MFSQAAHRFAPLHPSRMAVALRESPTNPSLFRLRSSVFHLPSSIFRLPSFSLLKPFSAPLLPSICFSFVPQKQIHYSSCTIHHSSFPPPPIRFFFDTRNEYRSSFIIHRSPGRGLVVSPSIRGSNIVPACPMLNPPFPSTPGSGKISPRSVVPFAPPSYGKKGLEKK